MGFLDHTKHKIDANNLITLTLTTELTDEVIKIPKWQELKSDYQRKHPSLEYMCMTSVINSILTQNRIFFVLTRDKTENLVRSDKNWQKAEFNTKSWSMYLKHMYDENIIKMAMQAGRTTVYQVTIPSVLECLEANHAEQLEEAHNFINRIKNNKPSKTIDDEAEEAELKKSDTYIRSSKEVKSEYENNKPTDSKLKEFKAKLDKPENFQSTAAFYAIEKIKDLHGDDALLSDDPVIEAQKQRFIKEKEEELWANHYAKKF